MSDTKITVAYLAVDGAKARQNFDTIEKARSWAIEWVGRHPEVGRHYAVSGDGVGRITCSGCSIHELFGLPADA